MLDFFENIAFVVEAVAVLQMMVGLIVSTVLYLFGIVRKQWSKAYLTYRRNIGRTLVLTLEFLIAADILDTIVAELTLASLGLLGGLVIVRTFLSYTLELEVTGLWPWQRNQGPPADDRSI